MTQFVGADVAQLTQVGHRFTQAADQLDAITRLLDQRVADPTIWAGSDGDRFRAEWSSANAPALTAAANRLRDASASLLRNADDQDHTSSSAGDSTGSAPSSSHTVGATNGHSASPGFSVSPQTLLGLGHIALGLADEGYSDSSSGISYFTSGMELGQHVAAGDVLGSLNDTTTIASDLFKEAPPGSAPHLFGQAMGIWQFVGEQAAQADFSSEGLQTVGNYTTSDPLGAALGAGEGIVRGLPGILGAVL